jgi:capsular exopolysaccharide synthesis family protein
VIGRGRNRDAEKITFRRGLADPTESSAEPFRTLRVSLELRPDARRGNIVVFTSSEPGEGKSTIAANYAAVSAINDRRILLIDADLRNPTQHEIFGVPRTPGLTEMIVARREANALKPITAALGMPGLDVITAGTVVPRAGDISGSSVVRDLLTWASREYDTVVIDTPPVLAAADAAHIAAHPSADVAFVVTSRQRSRRVSRALAKLALVNANVLGFVLNREGRLSTYGYG